MPGHINTVANRDDQNDLARLTRWIVADLWQTQGINILKE